MFCMLCFSKYILLMVQYDHVQLPFWYKGEKKKKLCSLCSLYFAGCFVKGTLFIEIYSSSSLSQGSLHRFFIQVDVAYIKKTDKSLMKKQKFYTIVRYFSRTPLNSNISLLQTVSSVFQQNWSLYFLKITPNTNTLLIQTLSDHNGICIYRVCLF